MLVYLLRSGIAEDDFSGDEDRDLTHDGIMQSRAIVRKFRVYAPLMDLALISPYQSAKQTSEALALSFPKMQFDVSELLTPDADVYAVMDAIESFDVQQLLMIVHNPLLSICFPSWWMGLSIHQGASAIVPWFVWNWISSLQVAVK